MITKQRSGRTVLIAVPALAVGMIAALATPARAQVWPQPAPSGKPYVVRDLDLPTGATASRAAAVNSSGSMVGDVTVAGLRHAAIWDAAGQVRDLGAPEGGQSWAVDVADNGWVAGTASEADGATWAWVWTGSGGLRRLDGFGVRSTQAVAVNGSGQVAVQGDDGVVDEYGQHGSSAWLWTPGLGARRLGGLGGWRDVPMALNDAGQLAGSSAPEGGYPNDVVFWDARGQVTNVTGPTGAYVMYPNVADLDEAGTLAAVVFAYSPHGIEGDWTLAWDAVNGLREGSFATEATGGDAAVAINDRGRVVAASRHDSGSDDVCSGDQATVWTLGEQPQFLPVGACYSNARAINDPGEVGGTGGFAAAWVWDGKKVHVLPGRTGEGPPWSPPGVAAMNDAGAVVGTTLVDDADHATSWVTPAGSVSVRVTAAADTYVNPAASGSFGGETTLAAGGDAGYVGLMRFSVPPTPAGRRLVAARLHLRTSSQSFAGSAVAHRVRLTTAQWGESTTWTSRPRLGEVLDRTFVGATGADQAVASYLDTRKVHPGRDLNLAVTGDGPDSVWWFSRESAPQNRPTLELIYR